MIGYGRLRDGDTRDSVIISPLVFVVYLSGPSVYRASHGRPHRTAAANQPQPPPAYATRQKIIRISLLTPLRPSPLLPLSDKSARDGRRGMTVCDQATSSFLAGGRNQVVMLGVA